MIGIPSSESLPGRSSSRTRESDCGAVLEKLDGDGADGMKKNSNGMEGVRFSDGGVLNHRPL